MHLLPTLFLLAVSALVWAAPVIDPEEVTTAASPAIIPDRPLLAKRAVNPALVPSFGVQRGVNPNAKQRGSCDGSNGQATVLIPCFCPPDRAAFIAKLDEAVAKGNVFGTPISFSNDAADRSPATNKKRATAMLVVLQSFNGTKGDGCPGAAAPNFVLQQKDGRTIPAP